MPEALFKPKAEKLEPDLEDIGHLASEFRTSLTATAMRYVKLSDSRCALVQSEKNAIKWIERSESFGHWVNIGDDLHPHTAAADFFKGKEIETGKCDVLAHTWLEGDIHSNSVIWEHSIAMPRYNAVLTLLSIDEDFEDPDEDFEDYRSEAKWARW